MKKTLLKLCLLFGVFLLPFIFVSQVSAATIYVNSSSGNDSSGDGSSGSPYKTFHKGYTQASDGDTLDLTGTFDWSSADETGDSAVSGYTISKNLTLDGSSPSTTIFQANSTPYTADRRIFTFASGKTITVRDMTIQYGVGSSDYVASAIDSTAALTMLNTIIYKNDNNARFGSAAVRINNPGTITLSNSTFDSNGVGLTSPYPGYTGALEIRNSSGNTITNTTFYNNYAQYNGALWNYYATTTVTNCTFIGNKGSTSGSDIHNWYGTIYLKNSILADKTGTYNYAHGGGTTIDGGYNIIETVTGTSAFTNGVNGNIIGEQANLNISSSLATNGSLNGTTTLALQENSVAINAGDSADHNGVTVPTKDQREFPRVSTVDIGAYEYGSSVDSTAPVVSSVSVIPSNTSATFTWTTDEVASSIVQYGPETNYGFNTSETDTSPRVTSHSVTINDLVSCTKYYYRVKSSDGSSNQGVSSQSSFVTTGCEASTITDASVSAVTVASGGTVSYANDQSTATITAPTNFTASTSATLQINKLDSTSTPTAPSGTSLVNNNFYELKVVADDGKEVSTFDSAVTFTIEYGSDTESTYDETSLDVYKYSGGNWEDKNCTLDTSANTLTCSLSSFSTYALFGNPVSTSTSGSSNDSVASSEPVPIVCHDSAPFGQPEIFQIDTTENSAVVYFTPIWQVGEYFLSYSENESAEEHGLGLSLGFDGVQKVEIGFLKPNTKYYFKVRGQRGCAPGDWSVIINSTTKGNVVTDVNSVGLTGSQKLMVEAFRDQAKKMELDSVEVKRDLVKSDEEMSLTQPEDYQLKIKVMNGNEPVVGAEVELHSTPRYATTDENGVAIFNDVEEGDHKLKVNYDGYETQQDLKVDGEKKDIEITLNVTLTKQLIPNWAIITFFILICGGFVFIIFKKK